LFFSKNPRSDLFVEGILQEDAEVKQSKNEITSLFSKHKKETYIEIDDSKK
jgi:hypothetical protein